MMAEAVATQVPIEASHNSLINGPREKTIYRRPWIDDESRNSLRAEEADLVML